MELNLEPSQVGMNSPRNITAGKPGGAEFVEKLLKGLKRQASPDTLRLSGLQGTQLIEFAGFVAG
ncbi:hypothetical protein ACNKHP_02240 [Shigella boydii]